MKVSEKPVVVRVVLYTLHTIRIYRFFLDNVKLNVGEETELIETID